MFVRTSFLIQRFVLILLCLILAACGGEEREDNQTLDHTSVANPHDGIWQTREKVPIQFHLDQTFGSEDEGADGMLASIGGVGVDQRGNVYILDYRANQILAFSEDGNHLWTAGGAGDGPGELNNAMGLAVADDGTIFITNQRGFRIERFDPMGQFVKSYDLQDIGLRQVRMVGVLDAHTIAVKTSLRGRFGTMISVIRATDTLNLEAQFEIDQTGDLEIPEMVAGEPYAGTANGSILVGHLSEYQIEVYDDKGERTQRVTREFEDLVPPHIFTIGDAQGTRFFSSLMAPLPISDGRWIVQARWPTNLGDPAQYMALAGQGQAPRLESDRTLDFFDQDWALLYSLTGDNLEASGIRTITATDNEGRIYSPLPGEAPVLGRYRLEISED